MSQTTPSLAMRSMASRLMKLQWVMHGRVARIDVDLLISS